ncbi:uncharacterized protein LOC131944081 [Physella acuta]|uniref:uncharacterized protein LOC131944081 n=1 Tax=Physella acuta TaxID=109671 RepID=UPI0027DB6839|nr:uncharacterized protein LOC131944081 [Physella acuta]
MWTYMVRVKWASPFLLMLWCQLHSGSSAFTDCGGKLTDQAGAIMSPNFPESYPDNTICGWTVTVSVSQVIDFRFKRLDLERYYDQYCIDYVNLYDGPDSGSTLIGTYCGYQNDASTANIIVRTTGYQLYIEMRSDSSGSRPGFSASYWAQTCPEFFYGLDYCQTPCVCDQENTEYCNNQNGSCNCKPGWLGRDCSVDINECEDPNICVDVYSVCSNTKAGYDCLCKPGLQKNITTGACYDVKECKTKTCSHACGVTSTDPWTEVCYCPRGMRLSATDDKTCQECDDWTFGDNCEHSCSCVPDHTKSCNKVTGLCNCKLEWFAKNCEQDVDECILQKPPCTVGHDNAVCYNTEGSFDCRCIKNFESFNKTFCDECGKTLQMSTGIIESDNYVQEYFNVQTQICNWTLQAAPGQLVTLQLRFKYQWVYHSLYVYDGVNSSSNLLAAFYDQYYDANSNIQLIRSSGNKMFITRNAVQYTTYSTGFTASYWMHECPEFFHDANCSTPCPCVIPNSQKCMSLTGECVCKPTWKSSDCSVDVDECQETPWVCPDYTDCNNLIGGYECLCKEGMVKSPDNASCVISPGAECPTSAERNCSHVCVSITPQGQSSPVEMCYCPMGMKLQGDQCFDCTNLTYGPDCRLDCPCVHSNILSCHKRYGTCNCTSNFTGSKCTDDVDECTKGTYNCRQNSICANTIGGYICPCENNYGYYESSDGTCVQLDCNHVLTNASESVISPNPSYNFFRNANCYWSITVEAGKVVSLKFDSFYLYSDYKCALSYLEAYDGNSPAGRFIGRYCIYGIPSIIRTKGNQMYLVYVNTYSYSYASFYGSYTSHVCRSFTYGLTSCDTSCKCVKENTQFCDNTNGECICKPGWTMGDCSADVNECLATNKKVCPENSFCINSPGSYACSCLPGFVMNATTGTCDVSTECTILKCSHACTVLGVGEEQCLCPYDLELDKDTHLDCIVPYYIYGEAANDKKLSENILTESTYLVSTPIKFISGAPFNNATQPEAYVLSNGVFGFGSQPITLSGTPNLKLASQKGLNIIAAYWADIDPDIGNVYYHLYERCGHVFSDTNDMESPALVQVMMRASKDVQKYFSLSGFEVNKALVVTWENVQPFAPSKKFKEFNTIQAIYVSGWETETVNGRITIHKEETAYVIFIYQQGQMSWNYVPERPIVIGTTGNNNQNFVADLNSPLVVKLSTLPGNKGYTGITAFEVGQVSSYDTKCYQYICSNSYLLDDPVFRYDKQQLYTCPCTLERLGRQWQLYEKRGEKQDIYCYSISNVAKRRMLKGNKRNMLCCYRWTKPNNDDWRDWLQTWREATYLPASSESGHLLIKDPWSLGNYDLFQAQENMQAHQWCCKDASQAKYCDWFFKVFSDKGCSNVVVFVPASALGDPTITTLDGLNYAMNGWGEYCMMEIPSENFTIQTRTGRAVTVNGTLSSATVFIGFAVKESNQTTFQVLLSSSNTTMLLMSHGVDITNDFYKDSDSEIIVASDSIQITREYKNNRTIAVVNFASGVTIHVHVAVRCLEIMFEVPKDLQGKTRGLLGNFNGDKTDEFITPDGQVLSANLSEREVFQQFSQKWAVNASTSIFLYGPGEKAEDFQHPEFTPMFKDEAKPEDVAKAVEICGDKNDACIFDFLATGDQAFAENTKSFSEQMAVTIQILANNPPSLTVKNDSLNSNGRWLVKHGTQSNLQLIAEDEDHDAITFEILGNVTDVTIDNTGLITYTPNVNSPVLLQIRAKDSKGAVSPSIYIPITVCPLCSGHGVCDPNTPRQQEFLNGQFQILVCKCFPAYKGQECDSELDGCAVEPCSKGQNCTDLTAAQQGNNSIGYACGPCPNGFFDWKGKCVDIDECNVSSPCSQVCSNTEGSFVCSCQSGYRLDTAEKKTCLEINECEERTSKCQQKCTNTKGNYSCSCQNGYTLDDNGYSCTIDSSQREQCYQCQQVCSVTNNQVNCSCRLGYEVDPTDNTNCIDINECEYGNKPCSQSCINQLGTYQCSCYTGFKLGPDGVSCAACEKPYYGENCENICQCSSHGSCDTVRGCVCDKSWTGDNCELDVDECAQPNSCPEGFVCKNKIGSFSCVCPDGYKLDNGVCLDINECTDIYSNTTCDRLVEVCINTVGSYSCSCKKGYARNAQSVCEDINECEKKVDKCEQICDNKPGSYNCLCQQGFYLSDDRWSCVKVKDTCVGQTLNCSYGCGIDADNMPSCYCARGFKLKGTELCEDINECLSDSDNKCANKTSCVNTDGSYTCSCEAGTKLDNDGRSCIGCSGETWGIQCNKSCSCGSGADYCDLKTGCVCKSGYTGKLCNIDIDECTTEAQKCGTNEKCVNLPGSATCQCQTGYVRENGACADFNECSSPTTNNCLQLCNNFVGGYSCACFHGYFYNSTTNVCSDINECQQDNTRCEQLCINTEGSYRCSCTSGLLLQPDGLTCRATIPCTTKTTCSYQCATINDTETCLCSKGTTLAADGLNCDDLDLCARATCKHGCVETQQNTSTECVCPIGQTLSNDGITCDDCIEGSWGAGCNNTCSCKMLNTDHCDKVTGSCQCKIGWGGATCEDVVIDCRVNKCSLNYKCMSTSSGYICVCDDGFSTTGNTCTACEEGYWGTECNNTCSCSVLGTSTCDKVSGTCQCKSGWSGTNCDKDVDECLQNTNICPSHSHCSNIDGGFVCACDDGYFNSSNTCEACVEGSWGTECNKTCSCSVLGTSTCDKVSGTCQCKSGWSGTNCDKDVDECIQNTNNCPAHSHCNNTEGSFVCVCDEFYFYTNNKCEACEENYYGPNCTLHCVCNTSNHEFCTKQGNEYVCSCDKGFEKKCNSCDCEDIDECALTTPVCEQICTNTIGSVNCSCKDGFAVSPTNSSKCHETSKHNMTITFNLDVSKLNLEDKNSDDYKKTKDEVESQMYKKLKATGVAVTNVSVQGLKKGSLIADILVLIDSIIESSPDKSLTSALQVIMTQGVTINNVLSTVINLYVGDQAVYASTCEVRQKTNPCRNNEACIVENGATVCRLIADDDRDLTLGLGIGLPLAVLACVVTGVVVYFCKKTSSKHKIFP